ncbi:MAG: hypothetical protein WBB43_09770 [Limnoraphis sp.]
MMEFSKLTEKQRYNLILSLALNIQTRANHFDTHTPLDALVDLRTHYFITCNSEFYAIVESLNHLTQLETLNLLIDLANELKATAIQEAFLLCKQE